MRSHDWFILGARLLGLWILHVGINYLVSFADFRISDRPSPVGGANVNSYLIQAMAHGAVAFYLLFGTRHLAQLCYWEDDLTPQRDEAKENSKTPEERRGKGPERLP